MQNEFPSESGFCVNSGSGHYDSNKHVADLASVVHSASPWVGWDPASHQYRSALHSQSTFRGRNCFFLSRESKKLEREEESKLLPDHLVEKIVSRVSFQSLFKCRVLSKAWLTRFSSISTQDDEEADCNLFPTASDTVFQLLGDRRPVLYWQEEFLRLRASHGSCITFWERGDGDQFLEYNVVTDEWSVFTSPPRESSWCDMCLGRRSFQPGLNSFGDVEVDLGVGEESVPTSLSAVQD
ncbi:unnamed protein product [Calypogeia fissa]